MHSGYTVMGLWLSSKLYSQHGMHTPGRHLLSGCCDQHRLDPGLAARQGAAVLRWAWLRLNEAVAQVLQRQHPGRLAQPPIHCAGVEAFRPGPPHCLPSAPCGSHQSTASPQQRVRCSSFQESCGNAGRLSRLASRKLGAPGHSWLSRSCSLTCAGHRGSRAGPQKVDKTATKRVEHSHLTWLGWLMPVSQAQLCRPSKAAAQASWKCPS